MVVFGQSLGGAIAIYNVAHSPPTATHPRPGGRKRVFRIPAHHARETRRFLADLAVAVSVVVDGVGRIQIRPKPWPASARSRCWSFTAIRIRSCRCITGKRLFELAQEPKQLWIVSGGGHIQAFQWQSYRDRFVTYLTAVLSAASGSSQINVAVAAQARLFIRPVGHQLDEGGDILLPMPRRFISVRHIFTSMTCPASRRAAWSTVFWNRAVILFGEDFDFGAVQHQCDAGFIAVRAPGFRQFLGARQQAGDLLRRVQRDAEQVASVLPWSGP